MALADYRQCDLCKEKAFYDANLSYERGSEGYPPFKVAGEPQPYFRYSLGYLGDWAVLCDECAKTHKTAIVPIEPKE